MGRGINKWTGIGNCCADPEIRYTPGGSPVANITVACGGSYKNKTTGEVVDNTEFVRVVAFSRLAEIFGEYLKKGSQVYIEGRLQTRKWQDKSGNDRYTTEIVANEMQMIGSRGGAAESSGDSGAYQGAQGGASSPPATPQQASAAAPAPNDFDDDIPF